MRSTRAMGVLTVPKLWLQTAILSTVVIGGGLLACHMDEQSRIVENPGALPRAKSDVTPRLNASTYAAHGLLLERQGHYAKAVEQYREALKLTPNLQSARNRLGITLNKLGQHAVATEQFREAIRRDPGKAEYYNNLGFSLYLDEKLEEADEALRRAIEIDPSFTHAHMNRGLVLAKQGRDEEALTEFALSSSERDAYYNLAIVQTTSQRYIDAARSLEQALMLDPEFADARMQLRKISRLAAAEEQERALAEAAEREAREAIAQIENQPDAVATSATDTSNSDVVEAADIQPARALPPENVAAWAQIQAIVNAASALDLSPRPESQLAPNRLRSLFDELVEAMLLNAPWVDESLCRIEHGLGLLEPEFYY